MRPPNAIKQTDTVKIYKWLVLAGFCLLRISIFYHSSVRFLTQNGHSLVLTKEQEGGSILVTTGHDLVGTINEKSAGTREL